MDFLNFFEFKDDPFRLTPDPSYFYPLASHNEGLMLLDYVMEQKEGFCLVIGDPGTGKTTLLKVFIEKWRSKAEIAIILTPRLSPEEFLISVVEDLNITFGNKNKNEIIKVFRDFLIEKSAKDRRVIIIVDEAQNLPDETLEELRLLSNIETDKEKLLQIILIGQPELGLRLKTEQLRQLNQRITTRIHLRPLSAEEVEDYINYRMIKAGGYNLNVHKSAKILLYKTSKGIPRLINMLFSRALMAAYLEGTNTILLRHIHHAVKSLDHNETRVRRNLLMPVSAVVLSIILIIAAIYMLLTQHKSYPPLADPLTLDKSYSNTTQNLALQNNNTLLLSPIPHLQNKPQNKVVAPISSKNKITLSQNNVSTKEHENPSLHPFPLVEKEIGKKDFKAKKPATDEKQKPPFKILSIKSNTADIRKSPSDISDIVGVSPKGNQFVVLEESEDDQNIRWYQVFYEGERGWISGEAIDIIEINPDSVIKNE